MPLADDDRAVLIGPRIGFLSVDPGPEGGWPTPVPVWFEPAGDTVQLFTRAGAQASGQ